MVNNPENNYSKYSKCADSACAVIGCQFLKMKAEIQNARFEPQFDDRPDQIKKLEDNARTDGCPEVTNP